jgi:ribosome-associated protein
MSAPAAERATRQLGSEVLARRLAELVDSKQGEEIVVLDMRELVSYTDFLVIATARNERQAGAIVDEVQVRLKRDAGMLAAGPAEGMGEAGWVLRDYLDCVLHVFTVEARERYALEELWREAPRLELKLDAPSHA